MPVGAPLPDETTCRKQVTPALEYRPGNLRYNAQPSVHLAANTVFPFGSGDAPQQVTLARRISGNYAGTTDQIIQWAACKWGIEPDIVRAQAVAESYWDQSMHGDWGTNPAWCPPGHGLGVDGEPGQCPQSWGMLQVKYRFFHTSFPQAMTSTAVNLDLTLAVWRACYEGYETWLRGFQAPGHPYQAGDAWGCLGRWFSGNWYDAAAKDYIGRVLAAYNESAWELPDFRGTP